MNIKRNMRFLRAAVGTALLLAAVIGCKNESGGEAGSSTLPSTDGLLTITGIDGMEGKYAFVDGLFGSGEQAQSLLGAETVDKNSGIATGVEIKGGKVLIPIYAFTYINEGETVSFIFDNYSGNETAQLFVFIFNKHTADVLDPGTPFYVQDFSEVKFTNGKASKMWGEGEQYD